MTFDEYQQLAARTWNARSNRAYDEDAKYKIMYLTLGIASEAGEVADKVKKVMRNDGGNFTDEKKQEIMMELGDVLWYASMLAQDLGGTLEQVADMNIKKLADRAARGVIASTGDNR